MSLSLLLEKYDVSTEEGLQKALHEIEQEEEEVNESLEGALAKACTIEGRLRSASQAYSKLGEMKGDAQVAADMVEKTADLARDVSAKVRQLDLARRPTPVNSRNIFKSRVAECQRRVHDLIDLQVCSAGVEAAIKAQDYETGARLVSRFLSMSEGSVAAAPRPRDTMARAQLTLKNHLITQFEEAARKDDDANIERLYKLFPQIGCTEEGIDLLAKYLAKQAETTIRRASIVQEPESERAVHLDALTLVVEAGGKIIERARHVIAGTGSLHTVVKRIQPIVSTGCGNIIRSLISRRRTGAARAQEPLLAEMAMAHSRITLYFNFIVRKVEADAADLPEQAKKDAISQVEKIISECELTRIAQDLLGEYLSLERFYLEESVNKAIKLATPQPGDTTSSLVDDVFFIARKVIRRSITSGSVDGVCAVLNEVSSILEGRAAAALRASMKAVPEPLNFPSPFTSGNTDSALVNRLNRDVEDQRKLFIAYLNSAENGQEWCGRLAEEAVRSCANSANPKALALLESCAAGLGAAAESYAECVRLGLRAIRQALRPTAYACAQLIAQPTPAFEDGEDDADAVPQSLEALSESAYSQLSQTTADELLAMVIADIVDRAEALILQNRYDAESSMLVERRSRRLCVWCGCAGLGRERGAALTRVCAVLCGEAMADGGWQTDLPHNTVVNILARRTDLKIEDIKRLKL